ncbi:unnamed protein product [Diatraea saccharalis]|uniref:Uncharacterized protein n=1 Tax=Diatraea saccharalis TaxID=40085 RepID=A0A9P0FYR6_9NEOP|nr:unnamed protein product [Diatraea saccharalis]
MESIHKEILSKSKMAELQAIMTKMPLEVCCVAALPEFGLRWREVARAIRNARLPMTSASVARVICRQAAKSLPSDDIEDILAKLRLKLIATQNRTWHVIRLSNKVTEDSVSSLTQYLPARIRQALKNKRKTGRVEVQTTMLGDLIYLSIQLVSEHREGSVLYVATPPGHDVALVSSLSMATFIKAAVQGLGYKEFVDAKLYGSDVNSLLRINDRACNENVEHLHELPTYEPTPVITKQGIDYTNRAYDEKYIDNILGPSPPLLTDLKITSHKTFFDPSKLNKQINLRFHLKSDDVAKSLKSWVVKGALAPTSDFFHIFNKIKSNNITYTREDSD